MRTTQLTAREPCRLLKGELLLKPGHQVPDGAPDARAAWARQTGDLVEVVDLAERESGLLDVLLASVLTDDRRVFERQQLGEYERLDGTKVGVAW